MKTTTILVVAIFVILGIIFIFVPFGLRLRMRIILGIVFFILAGVFYYLLRKK